MSKGSYACASANFEQLADSRTVFVHFNLETTLNRVGFRYAIVPILIPGRRLADGREMLPVLDAGRLRLGACVEVVERMPIQHVGCEYFAHSLPSIRTTNALRSALIERYAPMFPNLTSDDILARGCAMTRLVLDQATPANLPDPGC